MNRLLVAWVVAVAAGCGGEGSSGKPAEPPPKHDFDQKTMPPGSKKGATPG